MGHFNQAMTIVFQAMAIAFLQWFIAVRIRFIAG
jgi:hypothetical protein